MYVRMALLVISVSGWLWDNNTQMPLHTLLSESWTFHNCCGVCEQKGILFRQPFHGRGISWVLFSL